MPELRPDTRTRVALDELAGVSLAGGPGTAAVTRLSDGSSSEWDASAPLAAASCPDLLTVEWEVSGARVSSEVDVVASRVVSLDEIRTYRPTEYALGDSTDEQLWAARARAEEVIERESRRHFQPVMRPAFVDRPNCTTRAVPMVDGSLAHDLVRVSRAVSEGGRAVPVRVSSPTTLDVSSLPHHGWAECAVVLGMRETPSEYAAAVLALAAWYLAPKSGPENATSTSTDAGVLRFVVGGVGGAPTSLPEVNALISRYGFCDLLVG